MRRTKERVNENFKRLPEKQQDFILSLETAQAIQTIGTQQQLSTDGKIKLNEEIVYVLIGLERHTDFLKNIKLYVSDNYNKAQSIYNESQEIFTALRNVPIEKKKNEIQQKDNSIKMEKATNAGQESRLYDGTGIEKLRNALRTRENTVTIKGVITNIK